MGAGLAMGLALAALATWAASSADERSVRTARFVVTASVAGELSTCGCRSGPQGGLARRSAYLARHRAANPDFLLLDGGDYVSTDPISGGVKTDSLEAYMRRVGYDAVAIGEAELAADRTDAGWPAGSRALGPPRLSANLFREENGRPLPIGERFVIRETGGVRVGITAVLAPELVDRPAAAPPGGTVLDPIEACRLVVPEMIEAGAELLVLLAHVPEDTAFEIGRAVPELDMIVIGHRPRARPRNGVDEGIVYVHAGDRGRWVAEVALDVDAHGPAHVRGGARGIELSDPADAAVHAWVSGIEADVRTLEREALLASTRSPSGPIAPRAAACVACHAEIHRGWAGTPHARAFETLRALVMHREPECASCHTGGGGGPEAAEGVGCAACHAVPAGHPSPPEVPRVEPASCRRCHDAVNSPDYDPRTYWPRILHRESGTG